MIVWILLLILIILIAIVVAKNSSFGLFAPITGGDDYYETATGGSMDDLELYMIRHGQASLETGELTELGKEQATKTGEYLKQRFGKKGSDVIIYTSPTQSAKETADIIHGIVKAKKAPVVDKRLEELDRGDGGKDFASEPELGQKLKDANMSFNKEYPDQLDQHKHSGEYFKLLQKTFGGENIQDRLKTLRGFVDELRKHGGPVIVISHSGVINLLSPDLVSVSQKGSYLIGDTRHGKNCTITYYEEKAGKPVILVPTNSVHMASHA
jgi:broad specificity phosphatase PhoE